MYIGYYVFGVGHQERHYITNPAGRTYNAAVSRDPAKARRFGTEGDAEAAVRRFLLKSAGGEAMLPGTEQVPW